MHIISVTDFPLFRLKFCSKIPYSAGRMLASKIAYSAQNYAGRIYPSLLRTLEACQV